MVTDLVTPLVWSYLDGAFDALKGQKRKPGRVEFVPGAAPAWDDCCSGQLYARLVNMTPVVGNLRGTMAPCGVLEWEAVIGLGLMRCAAVVRDDGTPPSPKQVSADGEEMTVDMLTLQQVIMCSDKTKAMQSWTPQGVDGGCHGGEWVFTARVSNCGCED